MKVRVFLDANVIASKTLRDWLFKLSLLNPGVLSLCSSDIVLEEALRTFAKRNPAVNPEIVDGLLERIRAMFDHVVAGEGSEEPVGGISKKDVPVHHAALRAEATHLTTSNLRDFQPHKPIPYLLCSPDELLVTLSFLDPNGVKEVAESEATYWAGRKNIEPSVQSVPDALSDAGAQHFSQILRGIPAAE